MSARTIHEPARELPVVTDVDLCVVGGSCTGVFAAVRAARLGARVAIVERHNCFGGVATAALVNIWHSLMDTQYRRQIIASLTLEVIERLKKRQAVTDNGHRLDAFILNTEELKFELDELVTEHGIEPFLHTFFAAPIVTDGELRGVIVENKSGRQAILAKVVIDATGDGDVARALNVQMYDPGTLQPPTTCAKIGGIESLAGFDWQRAIREHGHEFGLKRDWGWGCPVPGFADLQMRADTHVFDLDTSRGDQLTRAEIEGRRQVRAILDLIRAYGPADQQVALADLGASIGARETRRVSAAYKLTGDDVLAGRRFDDAIANGSYRVAIHHHDSPGITFRYLDGTEVVIGERGTEPLKGRWREPIANDPTFYQVPYRCLLQDAYPNLLLAGRVLDADKTAFSAVRVMVNMNQTGEAAGTAAWLTLDRGCSVQQIDTAALRQALARGGSIVL